MKIEEPRGTPAVPEAKDNNIVRLPAAASNLAENRGVQFVKDHPVLTIAGGLAVGALAAALIPRRNREYVSRRTSALADAVTTASLALASQALEKAEAAGAGVSHQAHRLAERAGRMGERAASSAHALLPQSRPKSFGEKLTARADKLRRRLHR